jgi:hypothetical protein
MGQIEEEGKRRNRMESAISREKSRHRKEKKKRKREKATGNSVIANLVGCVSGSVTHRTNQSKSYEGSVE